MRISDFGFSIPQSAKEAKMKRTENIRSTRAMKGAHRNHTILLVDDEDLILEVLVKMFEEMGYRTYSARCAEEVQKVMGRAEIEVVVSDMKMPGLSGIDLLRWIKKNHPMTEVIMMTAYASVDDGVSLLKEGACDYLRKPFSNLDEVVLVVSKAVAVRRMKIENIALTKSLEQRVQERTRELEEAMEALKNAQTQLVQQEKMASIGQLAAGVAHEINNPVAFVSTNLQMLKEYMEEFSRLIAKYNEMAQTFESEDLSRVRSLCTAVVALKQEMDLDFLMEDFGHLIEESLEGIERVRRIVMDLRHFSHRGEEEMRYADLNEELESTLNIVWNELKYKATVVKEYGDLPQIPCYPTELNQVFMNLLVNAAHAIPDRGEITVRTYQENGKICVQICDTGEGIPEENLPKLFEPFFTTKASGKGTGLGLSIAYSIVAEKHHGSIVAESEVGKGSTFTITLPIEQE